MNLIGFDFGTTNSLVSQVLYGRVVNALDDINRPTPSLVCYEHNKILCGFEAKRKVEGTGLGIQDNVVRSPKRLLSSSTVWLKGIEKSTVEIVSDSVSYTLKKAKSGARGLELNNVDGAVVTIPVTMGGGERTSLRRAFLQAGIKIYQFIYEPFAALYAYFRNDPKLIDKYQNQMLLVVDWGGGTLDVNLCKINNNYLYQIANTGLDDVGGDAIDTLIMEYVLDKVVKEKGLVDFSLEPGAKPRLLEQCENAKISLSTREHTIIYVESFFSGLEDNSFECPLSKKDLEKLSQRIFDKAFMLINDLLDKYNYSPEQIALCLFIGGMSNIPYIASRMHEVFGPLRAISPKNRSTLVAEGAAWFAYDKNNLYLAKNIEIELARTSYFPLLKCGTQLPSGEECTVKRYVKLYSCDPRDGVAKIIICTPEDPGKTLPSSQRICLETMNLGIDDKAKPFFEDIDLEYPIDENLIINLHAISSHLGDECSTEIHNIEFGIILPETSKALDEDAPFSDADKVKASQVERGGIRLRSNITSEKNNYYIPGDLLYEYDRGCFDVRLRLPQVQHEEKYYRFGKCSLCGRKENDPLCQCRPRTTRYVFP